MTITEHIEPNDTTYRGAIAVYGTLREGFGNDVIWTGKADKYATGTVAGYHLRTNGAFPYAVPSHPSMDCEANEITVEIIMPHYDTRTEVLARCDRLEGYPRHYNRKVVSVAVPNGSISCWMYVPTNIARIAATYPEVPGGDWENAHPHAKRRDFGTRRQTV